MKKKTRDISPDGKYGLAWGRGGSIQVVEMASGEEYYRLIANNAAYIQRAAFSRDMRRILCLNDDGSVGIYSMPPKEKQTDVTQNIVEYFRLGSDPAEAFILRRR